MYRPGTVVLVPFPFTDLSGNKIRPETLLYSKKENKDVIAIFVSSQNKKKIDSNEIRVKVNKKQNKEDTRYIKIKSS
jgi:mRNA interferase MazF